MTKGVKIGADVAPIFLLIDALKFYGLDFGLIRYLPWVPKIDEIFDLLESLWRSFPTESIRPFETRTDRGYRVLFFVAYAVVNGAKRMRIVYLEIRSLIDDSVFVLINTRENASLPELLFAGT